MVRSFHRKNIRHKIRSKGEIQSSDDIGSFRLASRETKLGKVLVWAQHDQVWSEYYPEIVGLSL